MYIKGYSGSCDIEHKKGILSRNVRPNVPIHMIIML